MWTKSELIEDLHALGLRTGMSVLAHTSLRAIGKIEGGAERLVEAFRDVLGPTGTLLVPTFSFDHLDPTAEEYRDASEQELERMRTLVPAYDISAPNSSVRWTGVFPEIVRQQPDAQQSQHPMYSFAAIGANAAFLTQQVPYHYPLGSNSPLARLHQIGGEILLIGVSHRANASIHLAEIWADVPYIHRTCRLKIGGMVSSGGEWSMLRGTAACSEGFSRIEPVLRQARVIRTGKIGNAACQRMQQRAVVSMAVAMLTGNGSSLLCNRPECETCALARKFTAEPLE